jgi:hypothetical protein
MDGEGMERSRPTEGAFLEYPGIPKEAISPKRRRRTITFLGVFALLFWAVTLGLWIKTLHAPPPQASSDQDPGDHISSPRSEWMEIYLKGKKIGYCERHISPAGEGYLSREEMIMHLNLMGRASSLRTVTHATLSRDYALKGFYFLMTSGAVRLRAQGNVEAGGIRLSVGEGRQKRELVVPVSGPVMISSAIPAKMRSQGLEVGKSFSYVLFDPSVMTQRAFSLRIVGKEGLEIRGIHYNAFRLEGDILGQDMIFWLDDEGGVLREEGPFGITLVRASEASALGGMEGGEDLYRLAAVPVEKKIWRPERLTFLKLRALGLPKTMPKDAEKGSRRQVMEGDILSITREQILEGEACEAPHQSKDLMAYLKPETGIESDHPAIIAAARAITGDGKGPLQKARGILEWVYGSIEKIPVLSVPSALEVLEKKVGDCNEHAFLVAALLRAAGLPARVCAGLVYKEDAFYYHAWNEVYLGSWITMDAVSNQMPADPTHIKLYHGPLEGQFSIIENIGKIRLEVLTYGYD